MKKIEGLLRFVTGSGSRGIYQAIINQIRPHDTLIVPFLGTCPVTRSLRLPELVIANDANPQIVQCWRHAMPQIEYHSEAVVTFLSRLQWKDFGRTVLLIAPPKVLETRVSGNHFRIMDQEDHLELIEALLSHVPREGVDVIISTSPSKLYETRLRAPAWRRETLTNPSKGGRTPHHLYMNYPVPIQLHDDSFLGVNATDRTRFKRLLEREGEKLRRLNPLELQKYLNFVNEVGQERLQQLHDRTADRVEMEFAHSRL
jgi:hypothetical protein